MTVPFEISESVKLAVDSERRRIVGIILQAYAIAKLSGEHAIANALDRLALDIEKS